MPRMYAYARAVPWVDIDPRLTLAALYEDATLAYWTSVNGRIGGLAKAVIDLDDHTRTQANGRFDRIETILGEVRADLGGVKADVGEVRADLAELRSTVNRIDARVERQAAWIAGGEAKGRKKRS